MEGMDPIAITAKAPRNTKIPAPSTLEKKELVAKGMLARSDLAGVLQLIFHTGLLASFAGASLKLKSEGRWGQLALLQMPFAICHSFLFNGFHEMVHTTAFASQALNTGLAHVLGFVTFRGANWFWCFHWAHHRYTNDPAKDPELCGGSVDLDDPTRSLGAYFQFLSGYPFGFERAIGMARTALGAPHDPWVADKPEAMQQLVRREAIFYVLGYAAVAIAALLRPKRIGTPVALCWLLPHALGAGHLRMYQFAEHRACEMGEYTDTNPWICSRTTTTWWIYRTLAWQMPYHVEHHAFPNVPFHKLKVVHELVKEKYKVDGFSEPPTGCDPKGKDGYLHLHLATFRKIWRLAFACV
mmetsp:Transcript_69980/g.130836  ORF Transcript_69980/g.130836 Transcript_69980/m.130836 type:complete len:355 (-) Transcript_69980:190-1254(-)